MGENQEGSSPRTCKISRTHKRKVKKKVILRSLRGSYWVLVTQLRSIDQTGKVEMIQAVVWTNEMWLLKLIDLRIQFPLGHNRRDGRQDGQIKMWWFKYVPEVDCNKIVDLFTVLQSCPCFSEFCCCFYITKVIVPLPTWNQTAEESRGVPPLLFFS